MHFNAKSVKNLWKFAYNCDKMISVGTTDEIFSNPIHPYTKSLLSAIPEPNPIVEKNRIAETYDYKTSGIDYNAGTEHLVDGTHYVKCTDEEFAAWSK